ncbi:S-adenosyl-L-methionine dependent tRNA/rRNA methyltransferase, SpoU [Desulfovibrio sp. X2]|uniref:tRNA (cytidine(34)-2'-O)-methyltransferase n=1 Tax=Desulfovibrio sp. X2 TaxID=941449 RepID=UPI000358DDF3|nr:tRNA (cytidine(34)-2'-O)-methyltransferase [Desulfovibrio sp. X2]EPR41467.1 S-adenosyl-L-methionine dependent tRNA/rRNA methyltransferase, SpoU [Desulfovibrio sp. X2]
MHVVLFEPEIPPNTGSIARLCAATDTPLHLVGKLGFSLEDRYLKRAGLDYWPHVRLSVWETWEEFEKKVAPSRLVLSSARRGTPHHEFAYRPDDALVLGCETRGLPDWFFERYADHVRIPIWGQVRSINIANAASVLLYEAYRQTGGLTGR